MHSGKTIVVLAMMATASYALIWPGGRVPITNLGDRNLQDAASYAIRRLEAGAKRAVRLSISRITNAELQVVTGINYFFNAIVRVTNIHNPSSQGTTTCNFQVYKNLEGQYSLKKYKCKNNSLIN